MLKKLKWVGCGSLSVERVSFEIFPTKQTSTTIMRKGNNMKFNINFILWGVVALSILSEIQNIPRVYRAARAGKYDEAMTIARAEGRR